MLCAYPLNHVWQNMLGIPNLSQKLEIAKNITYQEILFAGKIGYEYENLVRLLKQNKKSVGITRKTITNLIGRF